MSCIFCKIISGEIPSTKVYEDKDIIIIRDIAPQAEQHYLLIPREHYANLGELNEARAAVLANSLLKVNSMRNELGLTEGYRIVSNCGEIACQTVFHLHIHILGGKKLSEKMA